MYNCLKVPNEFLFQLYQITQLKFLYYKQKDLKNYNKIS